jgi:hypothetical protein
MGGATPSQPLVERRFLSESDLHNVQNWRAANDRPGAKGRSAETPKLRVPAIGRKARNPSRKSPVPGIDGAPRSQRSGAMAISL